MANGSVDRDEPALLVDTHCHFFNIDDIPLYQFIARLEISLGMRVAALLPSAYLKKALRKFSSFFRFFESSRVESIETTCQEYLEALHEIPSLAASADQRLKVMTPLIMDFVRNETGNVWERLQLQTQALLDAIQLAKERQTIPPRTKILPFLGLSMQRLDGTANTTEWIDGFLDEMLGGRLKPPAARRDIQQLEQGDVIGIKLYPPLGFDPYPQPPMREVYLDAYRRLWQYHRLPFTVHCQPTAFSLVTNHEQWTDPRNWLQVLEHNNQELADLHINFGHFGGDSELVETIIWNPPRNNRCTIKDINRSTWTFQILAMLKQYPNTFADISAFDWASFDTAIAFRALLTLDENGAFDEDFPGGHPLADKLLWGSDYPMMLGRASTYKQLVQDFLKSFKRRVRMATRYDLERQFPQRPDLDSLLEKLFQHNPRRFLFS